MYFWSSKYRPYIRTRLATPQEKNNIHTGSTTPTVAFAPASTSGRPRGGRAQAGLPSSAPMPMHPRRDPGPKQPRAARPQAPPNLTLIRSTCMFQTPTFQLLDKRPWSQVSSLLPPGSCLQFLSRIGFSDPSARRFSSSVVNSRFRVFRKSICAHKTVPANLYEYALGGIRTHETDLLPGSRIT